MRKRTICICENKDADQLRSNHEFVFATWIVQYLFFLNTKFQASSHLQWLYRGLDCVRPGQNPHYWFSHVAAQLSFLTGIKICSISHRRVSENDRNETIL